MQINWSPFAALKICCLLACFQKPLLLAQNNCHINNIAGDVLLVKKNYLNEISNLSKVYKNGDSGSEVVKIQEWLMLWQLNENFVDFIISLDGNFGPKTESLVKEVQKYLNLPSSGQVDDSTWYHLTFPMRKAFDTESYVHKSLREKVKYFASKHMQFHSAELQCDNIGPWVRSYMNGEDGKFEYWCQGFVSVVLDQAFSSIGKKFTDYYPDTEVCQEMREYASKHDLLVDNEQLKSGKYTPQIGDIVLYIKDIGSNNSRAHHVEIVYEILDSNKGIIRTIGGNTNFSGSRNGVGVFLVDRNYLLGNVEIVKLTDEGKLNDEACHPEGVKKILKSYPNQVVDYKSNRIFFSDGTSMQYSDHKSKSFAELLKNPSISDQFYWKYPKGKAFMQKPFFDPGRIRNDEFFKKIYGKTKQDVEKSLKEVVWLPSFGGGQKINATTINGVNRKLEAISAELEKDQDLYKYITDIGGTFLWRKVGGTNRLSPHSYGMAIDINVSQSSYWQWDCKCSNEDNPNLKCSNNIPQKIIDIFEKHGFIWGGKWYHYDTMHFEYRPELLLD